MDHYDPDWVLNQTLSFITSLRERAPRTPILLIEGHDHTAAWLQPGVAEVQNRTREAYRKAYNTLLARGIQRLFYLRGELKFGTNPLEAQQAAVAGVHPEALGLRHMATYVSGAIATVLNGTAQPVPVPLGPWPPTTSTQPQPEPAATPLTFLDARELTVEGLGFGFSPTGSPYARLPPASNATIPAHIYELAQDPSGVLVRFATNATSITVNSLNVVAVHPDDIQTANGQRGFDLFAAGDGPVPGGWRWVATSAGTADDIGNATWTVAGLTPPPAGQDRNYTLYLPIYSPATAVRIGVPATNSLGPAPRYSAGTAPTVVWGSSIAQGGVVANAGATWPAQLQRLMDRPMVNLGFSGSCQFQPEVAAYVAKVTPTPWAVLVDCLPNMCGGGTPAECLNSTQAVAYGTLKQLRDALPAATALFVLEGHNYTNNWIQPQQAIMQDAKRAAQRRAFQQLQADGLPNIHYVAGDGKLGQDAHTADESAAGIGVHPTGLAHLHIAQFVKAHLDAALVG
jgi:hypothetical protein